MTARNRRAGAQARPGPGELARTRVSEIQRQRILAAMAECVAERGVASVTVAHVVARSGVSRRTFYEVFEDREDCFLAAFHRAVERATEVVVPAYAAHTRWVERMRAGLIALLGFLDAEPELGALCIVHALGAGPAAMERRAQLVAALTRVVDEGRTQRRGDDPAALTAEGVVGAVLAVLHTRLAERSPEPLVRLANPLMGMIVLPYLGPAAARRELGRPAPQEASAVARAPRDPLKDLDMRLTYRTVRVLVAIAAAPRASNREVADGAGIADQGQISKLLQRLQSLGLIENVGEGHAKGEPNAWQLTQRGREVERAIEVETANR